MAEVELVRIEIPIGTTNGINIDFTTSEVFVPGSVIPFLNGQQMSEPDDFTITGPQAFRMILPPEAPPVDHFRVQYHYLYPLDPFIFGSPRIVCL